MHILRICLAIVFILGFAETNAENEHGNINIYRSADGQLTPDSLKNAELLENKAESQGYVILWLTANVPFNPNDDELSPTQAAAQDIQVREKFREILQPLIVAGLVWHDPARPNVEGPGCLVRANASGLARLVNDTRLRHIDGSE